jgi:FeS assembly SUF system protein
MPHDNKDDTKETRTMMPPYEMAPSDGAPPEEGDTIRSGAPKDPTIPNATEEQVIEAMRSVYDPEIPVNIYDLGLIYDLTNDANGNVAITMTLTAPACPVAGSLPKEVADKVAQVDGVGEVAVTITWDPPWTQANMSEVAKVALDMF